MSNAIVFAGQGSQYRGMGADLIHLYEKEFRMAEEILYYSIKDTVIDDENNMLSNTLFTQPVIFLISALSFNKMIHEENIQVSYAIGHSLGELGALYAAGVYDLETSLKIVHKRAKLMSKVKNGAMAAIIGLDDDTINSIILKYDNLYISNYNSSFQTVIAGNIDDINSVQNVFLKSGAKGYQILNVSCPCHTPLMQNASKRFREYIEQFDFKKPQIPVISNYTGKE
jgi:trans-AT polyketide synthase, acyltransferase and oxidoreductase domains